MQIAIVGWGSLIWKPDGLPHRGGWRSGGPTLPIEFSRVSWDGRLTLIVDPEHGAPVTSRWSLSPRSRIEETVSDLAARERCEQPWIGFFDRTGDRDSRAAFPAQVDVRAVLEPWCAARGVDGVVWTALPATFAERAGTPFSVANALRYLDSLSGALRKTALDYVRNAPEEVDTPVRRAFRDDPRFAAGSTTR